MKAFVILLFALTAVFTVVNLAGAQTPATATDKTGKRIEMKDFINNKDYVFELTKPNNPAMDSVKYHKYHVAIDKDTLIAFLPLQTDSIKFNTTSYGYSCTANPNGGWVINIKPNTNMSNVKSLKLSVTSQGTATLNVYLPGRKPVVYKGYVKQEDY